MIKCNSAQSSFREFCKGVPVMRSLWLELNSNKDLYKRESSFFSLCASSTLNTAHEILPKNDCK